MRWCNVTFSGLYVQPLSALFPIFLLNITTHYNNSSILNFRCIFYLIRYMYLHILRCSYILFARVQLSAIPIVVVVVVFSFDQQSIPNKFVRAEVLWLFLSPTSFHSVLLNVSLKELLVEVSFYLKM